MDDGEPLAVEPGEIELLRQPGRQPDHGGYRRLPREPHGHRAAHGEAEHERSPWLECCDRGERILLAEVEPPPGLDPVADLAEAQLWKPRRQPLDEPLHRGAPGAGNLRTAAAVHADDGIGSDARDAQLGAALDDHHVSHASIIAASESQDLASVASKRYRAASTADVALPTL